MASPVSPSRASRGRTRSRSRSARPGGLRSILERRDVALVPPAGVVVILLMAALGHVLRPGERPYDSAFLVICVVGALLSGGVAMAIDTPLVRRWRGRISTYLWLGLGLQVLLTVVALIDGGLESPLYLGVVVLGCHFGLVLPSRYARLPVIAMLVASGFLLIASPGTPLITAVAVPALAVAGWQSGRAGHLTYSAMAKSALMLSRSDVLTATLNRRGFFEEFEWELARSAAGAGPLSLLVVDLDEFKPINDRHGHEAGDELLRWVGQRLTELVPDACSAGRLGGDEFGVLLPGEDEARAEHCATVLREALSDRIAVSIGRATVPSGVFVEADELMRVADGRMYADKHGGPDPAADWQPGAARPDAAAAERPVLTFSELRRRGGPSASAARHTQFASLFTTGFWALAVAGVLIGAATVSHGGHSFFDQAGRWVIGPWVLACCGFALLSRRDTRTGRFRRSSFYASVWLHGVGITVAVLAGPGTGLASPIMAGLITKVMFDTFTVNTRLSRISMLQLLGFWLLIAVLGPAESLWVMPYQLSIFATARAIGLVARRAFDEATQATLDLAGADLLTGLRNRHGFEQDLATMEAEGTLVAGGLSVLAFDLDDFKTVNDTLGHEAGDELLRSVASTARVALPRARSLARIGGDEFVAVAAAGEDQARAAAARLTAALAPVAGASVGYATYGPDGTDLDELRRIADERSYACKRARRRSATAA